jgi:uncharacterized protein (DUF433 family)
VIEIVVDSEIRFGKPSVKGTRITIGDVLSYLASGMSEQQILADFPQLTEDDIRACLASAAEREDRMVEYTRQLRSESQRDRSVCG